VTALLLAPKARCMRHAVPALLCSRFFTAQAALAPLRAASAAGASREPLLPLAPFAKYASDALAAGAKPWEGPPVLLSGVGADTADQPFWVRIM
jgi:hypothetical protein